MSLRCSRSIAATVGPQVVGAWEGAWLLSQSHPLAVRARRTLRRSFGHLASHPNHVPQPRTNNLRSFDILVAGAPLKVRPHGPTPKSFAASEGYAVRVGRVGGTDLVALSGLGTFRCFLRRKPFPEARPVRPVRPCAQNRRRGRRLAGSYLSYPLLRRLDLSDLFVGPPGLRADPPGLRADRRGRVGPACLGTLTMIPLGMAAHRSVSLRWGACADAIRAGDGAPGRRRAP